MDDNRFWIVIWMMFISAGLVVMHSVFLQHDLLELMEHCK